MPRSRSILPAAILIALGLLLLAGNLLTFDIWDTAWPLVLIALGVVWFIRGPVWLSMVSLTIGGIFLADSLGTGVGIGTLWPLIIIAVGVGILLERNNVGGGRRRRRGKNEEAAGNSPVLSESASVIDVSATFSGGTRTVTSQAFQGGTVSATFASMNVDLRPARLHENGADLQVSATFGEVTLHVPPDWVVYQDGSAVLAEIEDTRSTHPTDGPVLRLRTSTTLGSVTITD